jgi:glutaredoxin
MTSRSRNASVEGMAIGNVARLAILLLWSASAITTPGAQTLYKSVGPDGRVVYSDRPPAEGRLEKTMTFENLPSSPLPASTSSYVEQLRRMGPTSATNTPTSGVVLYSAAWCGFCKRAKAYLAGKGITYQDFDIDTKDGMAAFAQAGGGKGVPLLVARGQRVQGFSPAAYDALFANRK